MSYTTIHPFYSEDRGWIGAGELQLGERIRKSDGSTGTVTSLEIVVQSQDMWNLTVDEAHTFFVGDGEWLVHNVCLRTTAEEFEDQARQLRRDYIGDNIERNGNYSACFLD